MINYYRMMMINYYRMMMMINYYRIMMINYYRMMMINYYRMMMINYYRMMMINYYRMMMRMILKGRRRVTMIKEQKRSRNRSRGVGVQNIAQKILFVTMIILLTLFVLEFFLVVKYIHFKHSFVKLSNVHFFIDYLFL